MKIKTSALSAAFNRVARLTSGRQTLPILSHVLLSTKGERLSISSTDLDAHGIAMVDCEGSLDSPICVPASSFGALIASAGESATIKTTPNLRLKFESNGVAFLAGMEASEHVPFPEIKSKPIGLNTSDLSRLIKSVVWARSEAEDRYVLKSAWVKCSAKSIVCAATDGHLLAHQDFPAIAADCEFILHHKHAVLFCSALAAEGAELFVSDKHAVSKSPDFWIATRLLEGSYPNIYNVFDKEPVKIGTLDRGPLMDALSLMPALSPQGPNALFCGATFAFSKKGIAVDYSGESNSFKTTIPGDFNPWSIYMDSKLLAECLKSFETESINVFGGDKKITLQSGDYTTIAMGLHPKAP